MEADNDDAYVEDAPDDGGETFVHPKKLVNETPTFLLESFYFVMYVIQSYGWFILLGLVVLYLLYRRLQPHLDSLHARREHEQDLHRYDSNEVVRRQEAMDAARRKAQEAYNAQAARFAEEQKKKEEEKRKEKIADYERHLEGKGYRSKYRPPSSPSENPTSGGAPGQDKTKKKNTYRQTDYNPLTGTGGGACYRPSGSRSDAFGRGGG